MLGTCAIGIAAWGIRAWLRLQDQFLARLFERFHPSLGNQLINAVQLSQQATDTPVTEVLRLEAVARGRNAAAGAAVWPVVRSGVRVASIVAGFALLAWVCLKIGRAH